MNGRFAPSGLAYAPPPDGDLVDLRRLLAIGRRQLRVALLCTIAGTLIGVAWLAVATPLYTATATLLVNPLAGAPDGGGAPAGGAFAPVVAVGMFDSEIGILRSEKIAADAFATIDPGWLVAPPSPVARLKRLLRPSLASSEARRQVLLDRLRAQFTVERPEGAFLLELSYTAPSPEHAAAILDALVAAYLADRAERRRSVAEAASAAIARQIDELESRLAEAVAGTRATDLAGDSVALADARRRAEAHAAAIGQLLLREEESRSLAGAADEGVLLVSPPRIPVFDSSPNASRTLLLATLAGALAGVGVGLAREGAERGFRSAGQVRRELGVPCLAFLPDPSTDDTERGEALRGVKLALDEAAGSARPRLVGFAPLDAGDGASTIARDFALLLADSGAAALLLDADLRHGGLSGRLGLAGEPGFADLLAGHDVPPIESESGLRTLPAGRRHAEAVAKVALGAPAAGEALARAAATFDVAVVDLPPLAACVDGRAMARHLDALVIVARWRRTERRRLRALLAADRDLRRRLAGIILNRAAPKDVDRDDDPGPGELP